MRTAAAVVPSAAGRELLGSRGKTGLASLLRMHLQSFFRATALPRAWRFVDRLPEDAQGKVGLGALRALFAQEPGGGEPAQAAAHAGPHSVSHPAAHPRCADFALATEALGNCQRNLLRRGLSHQR